MAASASSITKVQQLYVAYYGRAGDPAGVEFWASTLDANGGNVSEMINQFGNSDEYTNGIGEGDITKQVTDLYQQMFNRAPETAGLDFWVSEISSDKRTFGEVAVAIAESALSDDATILTNKVTVAEYFTEQISATGATYEAANISAAQAIIASVSENSSTVTSANTNSDSYMTDNASGAVFTLTNQLSEPQYIDAERLGDSPAVYEYQAETEQLIEYTGMVDMTTESNDFDG